MLYMLYNTDRVMLCYITCVMYMLCYITYVMLYNMQRVMNMRHVMLYNMCHVML